MRFVFCDFSSPPVESTAPATKKWCQVKRSAAPVTQNHLSKPEDLMLQNAAPFRKSAPWPPNISDEHVFCTAPATQKHIWTSKSAPCPSVFCTFDFEMCFAPQRSALFRHRNFYKWFEAGVFCTFWLRNVLRAVTACNFSSIIWPDGSAPAALASLLFDPPELQIIGTTQCFATFLPFRASVLYSTLLFSLTLPISAFHLSILSEVWLLNFLRQWHNLEKGYR